MICRPEPILLFFSPAPAGLRPGVFRLVGGGGGEGGGGEGGERGGGWESLYWHDVTG